MAGAEEVQKSLNSTGPVAAESRTRVDPVSCGQGPCPGVWAPAVVLERRRAESAGTEGPDMRRPPCRACESLACDPKSASTPDILTARAEGGPALLEAVL